MFRPVSENEGTKGTEGIGERGRGAAARTPNRRWVRAVGYTLGGVLVIAAVGGGWVYRHLDGNIRSVDIDAALGDDRPHAPVGMPMESAGPSQGPAEGGGALNILLLGSDSRDGEENRRLGGGSPGSARADTAMVVHLAEGRTSATVVSIPRDTLVTRPACPLPDGGTTAAAQGVMFNSAYAVGGPVCAVKTVEALSGVPMDHYLEVDFAGFANLVDALGGVTVELAEPIDDDLSHLHVDAGVHHLYGEDALALARTRHGVGDGSDLGRIGLQQQLVRALLEQVERADLLADPVRLYQVADAATSGLTADTGLDSLEELAGLARSLSGLTPEAVRTVTLPVVPAPFDRNRVVPEEPEAGELWASLLPGAPAVVPEPSGSGVSASATASATVTRPPSVPGAPSVSGPQPLPQ
ncbi:LCP family protein [Streptomyces sp. NPDC047130]|uniref:LCP family protein n=1 Tax=Streptomyces sp. NPDC047130 TaxID=3155261 RepID=UPI0033E3C831